MTSKAQWIAAALAIAALTGAGCGDSDEPGYCSDVSDLQQSVDEIKNIQLSESDALSTLQTGLQEVQSNANAVVSSARQDFPNETSALKSSVSSVAGTIEQLPASPTAQQLAPLAQEVSAVVTAAKGLDSATSSACD